MGTERGGLDYAIVARDQFTATFRQFRTEVGKTRAALEGLRRSAPAGLRESAAATREAARATAELTRATQTRARAEGTANRQSQQELRRLAAAQRDRSRLERQISAVARQGNRDSAAEVKRREAAERQLARTQRERARQEARDAQQAARASREAARAERDRQLQLRRSRREASAFFGQFVAGNSAVNRVSFTFRRLFGILAAFAIAREAVGLFFRGLVGGAIQFNRVTEDATVGLGGLIFTLFRLTDAQGRLLEGAEGFAAAQTEARRQMALLRRDSLSTVATFEELIDAFQTALAPGVAAGFNLDQIREFSVLVSQAASAIRLPQNQLAEEVRSLLQGTATTKTTRLAAIFGGPNELNQLVRQAEDAQDLFQKLTSRLEGFRFAGEAAAKTFTGLAARIKDAFQFAAGTASEAFFVELKEALNDIGNLVLDIKRDGKGAIESITPNENAVRVLAVVFDGLRSAVRAVREAIASITFDDALNAAIGFRDAVVVAGAVVSGFVQGVIRAVGFLSVAGRGLARIFGPTALKDLTRLVALITQFGVLVVGAGTAFALLRIAIKLALLPLGTMLGLMQAIVKSAVVLVKGFLLIPTPLLIVLAIITRVALAFKDFVDSIAGFEVKLSTAGAVLKDLFLDTAVIIRERLQSTATFLFETVRHFGVTVFQEVRILVLRIGNSIANFFRNTLSTILGFVANELGRVADSLPDFLAGTRAQLQDLEAAVRGASAGMAKGAKDAAEETAKSVADAEAKINASADRKANAIAEAAAQLAAAEQQLVDNVFDNINLDVEAPTVLEGLESIFDKFKASLTGLVGADVFDTDAILAELDRIKKQIKEKIANTEPPAKESKFRQGLREMMEEMGNAVQASLNIIRGAVDQFASFVSSTIVDAFDPTKDLDIKERFAQFLQGIAQLIIEELTKLAIAKAVLGLGGFSRGGEVPGLAEGGDVPHSKARPKLARAIAPKAARSDTVPAVLTPGEYVQRLDAVRRYGLDFMEALNRGLIDPAKARALIGAGRSVRALRAQASHGPGFAQGGLIGDVVEGVRRGAGPRSSPERDRGPQPAVVVANDQSMERLLGGGRAAFMRFVRDNSREIDTLIRANRR